MDIANGTFTLAEQHGTLTLRAGHDLTLEATRWRAVVQHDGGRTTVEAEIDPRSLEVRGGTGGDIKKDL